MNTIIIEHADQSTTDLFKQLAEKLGLFVKTKKEKVEPGLITNPELIRRIEEFEADKSKPSEKTMEDLKQLLDEIKH